MKKHLLLSTVVFTLVFLSSCATTPQVFTDYDDTQSFDSYRTFSWISETPMIVDGDRGPNPIAAKRLQDSIKNVIEQKGFRFVANRSEADFVVSFSVGARDKIDVRDYQVVDYFGPHWRWGYNYFNVSHDRHAEIKLRQYAEGSLAIDVFDVSSKSPVWHASGSKRLTKAELRGQNATDVGDAVAIILSQFPPK